jgi:hypothetical protein
MAPARRVRTRSASSQQHRHAAPARPPSPWPAARHPMSSAADRIGTRPADWNRQCPRVAGRRSTRSGMLRSPLMRRTLINSKSVDCPELLTAETRVFEYRQLRHTQELPASNPYSGVRESLPGVLQVDSFTPRLRWSAGGGRGSGRVASQRQALHSGATSHLPRLRVTRRYRGFTHVYPSEAAPA